MDFNNNGAYTMRKPFISVIALLCALVLLSPRPAARAEAAAMPVAGTYRIEVDITNQVTTVFSGADGHIVRQMICSTGRYDGSTPLGDFKLEATRTYDRSEWYYIEKYKCYVKYPTRIKGPILFHSLPYGGMDMSKLDTEAEDELGIRSSHGCIRMRLEDARWIAENCADGTEVKIFSSDEPDEALRAALLEQSYMEQASTAEVAFEVLGLGSTGDAVSALQEDLIALDLVKGPASGIFDLETVSAVINFQISLELRATGSVDAYLRQRIADAAKEQQ